MRRLGFILLFLLPFTLWSQFGTVGVKHLYFKGFDVKRVYTLSGYLDTSPDQRFVSLVGGGVEVGNNYIHTPLLYPLFTLLAGVDFTFDKSKKTRGLGAIMLYHIGSVEGVGYSYKPVDWIKFYGVICPLGLDYIGGNNPFTNNKFFMSGEIKAGLVFRLYNRFGAEFSSGYRATYWNRIHGYSLQLGITYFPDF